MNHAALFFFAALLGACFGSMLNVVIYRLPRMIRQGEVSYNLCLPRSHCPHCGHLLACRDNIPLIGWLILRGRCRYCSHAISRSYPLVELTSTLLCLMMAALLPTGGALIASWTLVWLLLALALIDIEHLLLPDLLTLPLLWLGMLFQILHCLPHISLQQSVIGALSGYLALWLPAHGYRLLRGKEVLGMGDAKLLAALGAWLGWQALPMLLLLASLGSLIWLCASRLISQRSLTTPFPFGPGLAAAGLVLFIVGNAK
ncbi:leader peptidase (prepilin peptidase)/N-methyltransferase [Erwinia sp. JUb26]|nr:A24 family peptidase [Erwinia sp. JUb26]ROR05154.1 leader peptidase (prepilin peptidase)/N-methyltransferase [Erwinia sp. JUb26]